MAVALRRFGGGMASWAAWSFPVAGVMVLWDAATRLWFFDALLRLDMGAAQNPGLGSSLLRSMLGMFFPSAVWPIWAVTIGASVAVLAWPKLARYRVGAALFGISFGPALATILEGYSPIHGEPMALLVPIWLLVIAADTLLIWGVAWCILTIPKRAAMSIRTAGEQCEGTERLVIAAGAVVVFAAGGQVGRDICNEMLADGYKRQAKFNRALARMNALGCIGLVPELLRNTVRRKLELSRYGWSRFLGRLL